MRLRHLGYACTNTTLGTKSRTIRLANLRTEKLIPVITQNLDAIQDILRWNVERDVRFFRISSDLIPFATLPEFPFDWEEAYRWKFDEIRRLVKAEGLRVSSHPGQYTVLNSPDERIVRDAVEELEHQARVLSKIDPKQGTLTLHVGGAYGDKAAATQRFKQNFERLSPDVQNMLTLENDDTTYHLDDVLPLCESLGIPLVFDFFHHRCHHVGDCPMDGLVEKLERVAKLWGRRVPKCHLSSQRPGPGSPTAHADYVLVEDFQAFLDLMADVGGDAPYDLMLEAKQKECATLELMTYLKTGAVPERSGPMEAEALA